MPQYRKKPVVIEAVRCADVLDAMANDWQALPKWVAEAYEKGEIRAITSRGFVVETPEGLLSAVSTDMLIQGIKGELYPCKPDIFAATYDACGKDG
jgi:hypothetical protein